VRIPIAVIVGSSLGIVAGCAAPAVSPPTGVATAASEDIRPYTFRLVIEGDTVASDVVRRTPAGAEVSLINLLQGVRTDLSMAIAPDQSVTGATLRTHALGSPDTVPISTLVVEMAGDSVRGELTRAGRGPQRSAFPTRPGAVVYLETASATVEQVLRRARAMGGETATVPVFNLLTAATAPAVVRWIAADSAVVTYGQMEVHARMAGDGTLLEYTVPVLHVHAYRTAGAHPLRRESSGS
jgi:hypothetical protein